MPKLGGYAQSILAPCSGLAELYDFLHQQSLGPRIPKLFGQKGPSSILPGDTVNQSPQKIDGCGDSATELPNIFRLPSKPFPHLPRLLTQAAGVTLKNGVFVKSLIQVRPDIVTGFRECSKILLLLIGEILLGSDIIRVFKDDMEAFHPVGRLCSEFVGCEGKFFAEFSNELSKGEEVAHPDAEAHDVLILRHSE